MWCLWTLLCLRRILQVKLQDKISDTNVLEIAKLPSVHSLSIKNQARWAGHGAGTWCRDMVRDGK